MVLYYAVLVIAFIAALMAVESLYGMWNTMRGPEAMRLENRLQSLSAGGHAKKEVSLLKQRELSKSPMLEQILLELPRVHQLDRLLVQSGMNMSVAIFMFWSLMLFGAGFLLAYVLTKIFVYSVIMGAFFSALPYLIVVRAKFKRMHNLLLQLPDSLDLVARALRAGHAFSGGIKMVADEMAEPISSEFRATFDELNYGLSLEDAMLNMSERVDIPDMKYFVISVLIQRETGGNLAAVLDKIAQIIRDRLRMLGRIRVLSSQGRLEAWILSILPFSVAGIMFLVWPEFMSVLWKDPAGQVMIATAAVMMVTGIFIMWRMVRIRI